MPNEGGRHGARAPRPKESRGHRHGAAMLAGVAEEHLRLAEAADGLVELALPTNRTPAPGPPTTRHTLYRAAYAALSPSSIAWRIPSVKAADLLAGQTPPTPRRPARGPRFYRLADVIEHLGEPLARERNTAPQSMEQ